MTKTDPARPERPERHSAGLGVGERGNWRLRVLDRYVGVPILALAGLLKRRRPLPENIRRIGVLNVPAIGDTILLLPVLEDLAAAYPLAEILLFTNGNIASLARLSGVVEVVPLEIVNPRRAVPAIHAQKLDVLLDFSPWPRIQAIYCLLSGAKFTAGFRSPSQHRHYCYDVSVEHSSEIHELENFRRLAHVLAVDSTAVPRLESSKTIPQDALPPRPYAVFHLWPSGSQSSLKEWSHESWREVARQLGERGYTVVLTGSPDDAARTEAFVAASSDLRVRLINAAGKYALSELVDIVEASCCVISVNTGIMHLAAATGVPTVALNGPTASHRWGPVGRLATSVDSDRPGCGYLHLGWEFKGRPSDCMEGIQVSRVLDAVKELVDDR